MRLAVVTVVALCAFAPGVGAAPPEVGSRPETTDRGPVRAGSEIVFHGWSRDSSYVAYTRLRRGRGPTDKERQRLHRKVVEGQFAGFGTMVGGDVETHATKLRYAVTPLAWRRLSETTLEFALGDARLAFEFDVGRNHGWRLLDGDTLLAEHRFDRIYVGFHAELYTSPDRRQGVLVMHLDSGWDIDAAAYPVDLSGVSIPTPVAP